MNRRLALVVFASLLVACAPASNGNGDGGSNSTDGGSTDTTPVEPTCRVPAAAGASFLVDADGSGTIGARAAFDGTVWLAYSRVGEGSENFDVAIARLECDGTPVFAPRVLEATPDTNDVNPALAVGNDRVLVAWTADDSANSPNLSVRYSELNADGTNLVAPGALATTKDGATANANVWQPSAVALAGGRFLVAGARGFLDSTEGFRAFLQHLGANGQPSGDTLDVPADAQASMDNPVVTNDPDGDVLVAWSRDVGDDSPVLQQSLVQADGTFGDAADVAGARLGEYPSVVSAPWSGDSLLAFQSVVGNHYGVVVKDAFSGADSSTLELSTPAADAFGPQIALAPNGGAVAWFAQNAAGGRTIFAQSFTYDGHAFTAGTPLNVSGSATVGPESPAIVHVGGDLYFVAWSQGASPDFQLYGRFVELL